MRHALAFLILFDILAAEPPRASSSFSNSALSLVLGREHVLL